MITTLQLLTFGALSLLFTLLTIPLLKKLAVKINLVDKPNYRKIHETHTPLIGGIAIAFTVFLMLLISENSLPFLKEYTPIFSSGLVLLIVGVVDDKNDVKAKYKLLIQLLLSFLIALVGIRITSLYGLFGIHEITIWAQYVLTVIVITGVVNAFNLMDGVDGLVGGLSLLGFSMFLLASIYFKNLYLGEISIIFVGALIGFLRYNLSHNKIFLGDSGSLFLGFTLVTIGIKFMEGESNVQNGHAYGFLLLVSFFSIPVLDSLRVYLSRIKDGNSPFNADRTHIHHLLLAAGLTHQKVALCIVSFSMFMFFIGFGLISYQSTSIIILITMLVFWGISKVLLTINNLNQWRVKLKQLEQLHN